MGPEVPGSRAFRKLRWKSSAGAAFFSVGIHRLLLRRTAVIVAFHRVDNRLAGNPISCTIGQFRAYCDFFAEHFHVVSTTELLDRLRTGRDIGRHLAITFDDGYRDNYDHAAPELEARGLPATFFVATGLIGTNSQPWWDQEYGAQATWMTWDNVRDLHARGFEIGAHTVNHVDLGAVSERDAWEEISGSRERLIDELRTSIQLFSYPYGGPQRITDQSRELVRRAGFRCCFSAYGGVIAGHDDPFALRRSPITPWHFSPQHFGFEVALRR